jgi:CheY-like chemotaxis protein
VSEALAVAAIRAEKRAVQLTSDLGPRPAPFALAADPAELQQAIMNVVHNALDAARGRVHVQVGLDSPGPLEPNPTSVPPDRTAPRVLIDVDDDGPGIPTELADAIFSPYVSTKAPAEGTGLGLTLARRIAADHGGSLELARTDATGSLFRFTFPLTADLALDPPRPLTDFSVRALSTEDRPLAALVVDDEAHSREALAALLELAGFDVTAAVTPSEALGALTAKTAAFDLVITDLQLGRPAPGADAPQLPGLVLATRIAALAPTLPIIVVSGLPEHLRPKRLAHLTAAVFDKPVSPRALIETAQRLASAHRALTTNPERAP